MDKLLPGETLLARVDFSEQVDRLERLIDEDRIEEIITVTLVRVSPGVLRVECLPAEYSVERTRQVLRFCLEMIDDLVGPEGV